ncbi:class I SAM-dependent methyltransferase [Bifidobacterium miconisargentati]|uniref:class I SAM-dependent methyltransferase n=1 Tax=Bifidobacterium miconisargentati TaxID=2834437 RepID=UPI001BDD2E69|nr:class I SAM-dependent methyltransferase [Bifidobacterium miconisargentati]MBW3090238.1 class I SAM-dependent methyltransferase [Bifidobacterium miconisargentati]
MEQTKFHGKAQAYEAARPSYPAAAIRYIDGLIGDCFGGSSNAVPIADIGAGTGKFTVPLAGLGLPVYAVEPDTDMRGVLAGNVRDLSNVTVCDGSAEATSLPADCVDVITVAQALHWFSPAAFPVECRRIARDGRYLLVSLYNVTSFDSAMRPDDECGDRLAGSIKHFDDTKADFFRKPAVRSFPNPIRYTRDSWRVYMDSHSHSPLPGDADYADYHAWVDEIFDARAIDGILTDDTTCMVTSELVQCD